MEDLDRWDDPHFEALGDGRLLVNVDQHGNEERIGLDDDRRIGLGLFLH